MGALVRNLGPVQTFSILHVWIWSFACSKLQHQWQAGKYSQRIKIGECMRNINFPIQNFDIICGSLATQHARWHKSITLQEVEPSLRATLESPWDIQRCVSKAILHFCEPSRAQKSHFFMKFHHLTRPRVHVAKPWSSSNFFPSACMELRLCIQRDTTSVASGKILPSNKNWWIHEKS